MLGVSALQSRSSFPTAEDDGRSSLDMALMAFIRYFANNPIRRDIIAFFARRMDTPVTATEVAHETGYRPQAVRAELDDLVLLGLLEAEGHDGGRAYKLTRDAELRWRVELFGKQRGRALAGARRR